MTKLEGTIQLRETVTLEKVEKEGPHSEAYGTRMIFYSVLTPWWTDDPKDLCGRLGGIPMDPLGSVLYETDDIAGFFKAAREKVAHYGKHGLRAFMAAHAKNCRKGEKSWALKNWDEYNNLLDHQDAMKAFAKDLTPELNEAPLQRDQPWFTGGHRQRFPGDPENQQ